MRAWCSGNTKPFQGFIMGSNPIARSQRTPNGVRFDLYIISRDRSLCSITEIVRLAGKA